MKHLEKFRTTIREDPVIFLDEILGCGHWAGQDEIIRAAFKYDRTTVPGCNGLGKSFLVARLILAWMFAHK